MPAEHADTAVEADATPLAVGKRPGIASFPPVIPQNPYQALLYAELTRHGFRLTPSFALKVGQLWRSRRDVRFLHFHWPQGYYVSPRGEGRRRLFLSWLRLGLFAFRLMVARTLGYCVVWTVHEVYPHEKAGKRVDKVGGSILAKFSSLLMAHDRITASAAEREFHLRRGRVEIVPHASYEGFYPPGRERCAVRRRLRLADEVFVFLSFGHIRAYKDLGVLVSAFTSLPQTDIALVIAGLAMDEHSADVIRAVAETDGRIRAELRFIPDDEVAELFSAADAIVISRRDGGTSGALVLALTLGVPVVAAESYSDLTDGDSVGWLFDPGVDGSLHDALDRAASDPQLAGKAAASERRARELRWPEIGATVAGLIAGAGR
jgi:glycosyltransferase involved in cell wall biosynthesis